MTLVEGDVLRLSETCQAYVVGDFESVWLDVGTPVTVARVLGDHAIPSGYELEAFVRERCRYALVTVRPHEIRAWLKALGK
ncbi:hypothetical protein [Burkholderia ubonensis]|uniref:hypothetical protein n=2 Tax=Burkholderia ubonensis TaxID=101571 RepID=UPI000AF73A1C|nr:hypothetical protein [Burkholderia ubonensis]